jgi:hypothetical protein
MFVVKDIHMWHWLLGEPTFEIYFLTLNFVDLQSSQPPNTKIMLILLID